MGKASLIHEHNKGTTMWGWFFAFMRAPVPAHSASKQSAHHVYSAEPPLRFPSLTLTHLAFWATPAVHSGQRGIRWRCDEQKLLMPATHIQMRIMKPTHEYRHHGRATTSAPPLVLFSAYLSSEIQRGSTSARHIEDGCPSGRGMITQSCSPMTFPASSVILIPFPAE